MHHLKAPSPDGLPTLFFQMFWHIVGTNLTKMVLDILNNNKDLEVLNKTFIALISKCKNPSTSKDFRPISLCNMAIKVVTNTISNKLKRILPEVIDEEKSASVQGCLITDNALIATVCFH